MKRILALILFAVMAALSAGCVGNPDSSIVTNKDLDSMIEEAENTGEDAVGYVDIVNEVAENKETYKTVIEDESLGVTVNVDADVIIPETTQLSVMRVSQKKITQEFLDEVIGKLTPEVTYYDGSIVNQETKADIALQIQDIKNVLDSDLEDDGLVEEYEGYLADLEAAYEAAPDTLDFSSGVSDCKISSVKELADANPDNGFWQWEYDLNPDGEIYYGVSDARDGNYIGLYMQNNENYGNCLRFESTKNTYMHTYSAAVESGIEDAYKEQGKEVGAEDFPNIEADSYVFEMADNEPLTITGEEAFSMADEFIKSLGLTEYEYSEGGLCLEKLEVKTNAQGEETLYYREVYELLYLRCIDGIFVDNSAGEKLVDDWEGNTYVKKAWGGEAVVVYVNDSGIVGFKYLSPVTVDETIVENAAIKSFDEIKKVFEEMVVIQNAVDSESLESGEAAVSINIDHVNLVYARISEQDSFDTGLLVPVWNFSGTINQYGYTQEGIIISINAIDGSVIDWSLGY